MWRVQGRSHWSLLYSNSISIPNQPVKSQQHVLFSNRYWSHACVYPKSILHTKSKPLIYSVCDILNMPHAQCVCYVHIFCNILCRNVDQVEKFGVANGSLLCLKTGKVHPFIYPVCVCGQCIISRNEQSWPRSEWFFPVGFVFITQTPKTSEVLMCANFNFSIHLPSF